MKIEEGRYYRNRNGDKEGPMAPNESEALVNAGWPWVDTDGFDYRADGTFGVDGRKSKYDLVALWKDEAAE